MNLNQLKKDVLKKNNQDLQNFGEIKPNLRQLRLIMSKLLFYPKSSPPNLIAFFLQEK